MMVCHGSIAVSIISMICLGTSLLVNATLPKMDIPADIPNLQSDRSALPVGHAQVFVGDEVIAPPTSNAEDAAVHSPSDQDRDYCHPNILSAVMARHNQTSIACVTTAVGLSEGVGENLVMPLHHATSQGESSTFIEDTDDQKRELATSASNTQMVDCEDCLDSSSTRMPTAVSNGAENLVMAANDPLPSIPTGNPKSVVLPPLQSKAENPLQIPVDQEANGHESGDNNNAGQVFDSVVNNDEICMNAENEQSCMQIGLAVGFNETIPEMTNDSESISHRISRLEEDDIQNLQDKISARNETLVAGISALNTLVNNETHPLQSNILNAIQNLKEEVASANQNINTQMTAIQQNITILKSQQGELLREQQSMRRHMTCEHHAITDQVLQGNSNMEERMTAFEQNAQDADTALLTEVTGALRNDLTNGNHEIRAHVSTSHHHLREHITSATTTLQGDISRESANLGQQMHDQHMGLRVNQENAIQQIDEVDEAACMIQSRVKKPKKKSWRKKACKHAGNAYRGFCCVFKCLSCCALLL